ncbi:MAG: class I SAM-dependent methyltransferase [Dehalococcoidia bacterium]
MTPDEVVTHNAEVWDRFVASGDEWTRGASPEQVQRARNGDLRGVVLIGHEPVDRAWLPASLEGVSVLCLASGGGQQGPLLAAAGARVTVFDASPRQLQQDRDVAAREGLEVRTVLGDMRDLGALEDGEFEVIVHPVSNVFCPELAPVWAECFRVLRPGGRLLAGFLNPDMFVFEEDALDRGEFVVANPLPYSNAPKPGASMPDVPIEFSHTFAEQIGGQLAAGFTIAAFEEAPHHANATARYMAGYFATLALKPE